MTCSAVPPVDFMVTICSVFPVMKNLFALAINQCDKRKSRKFTELPLLFQKTRIGRKYPDPFIDLTVRKRENSPFIVIVLINSCLFRSPSLISAIRSVIAPNLTSRSADTPRRSS